MCEIDLEPAELWRETKIEKARRPHKCDCCMATIAPGKSYTKTFMVFDGDADSEVCCSDCDAAREEFRLAHSGLIGMPSTFSEMLRECFAYEGRQLWTDQDRRWRTLLAWIIRRQRAAV